MDYTVLEIARAYSDDAETLVKNYNRIVEGVKSSNKYTTDDLASFASYVLGVVAITTRESADFENILNNWKEHRSRNDE